MSDEPHRLDGAQPVEQPADAPRDENGDPVVIDEDDKEPNGLLTEAGDSSDEQRFHEGDVIVVRGNEYVVHGVEHYDDAAIDYQCHLYPRGETDITAATLYGAPVNEVVEHHSIDTDDITVRGISKTVESRASATTITWHPRGRAPRRLVFEPCDDGGYERVEQARRETGEWQTVGTELVEDVAVENAGESE